MNHLAQGYPSTVLLLTDFSAQQRTFQSSHTTGVADCSLPWVIQ